MANRTVLFGYSYINGKIEIEPLTADIVKEIFNQYLDNKSLLEISNMLNKLHIEYKPGVVGWNKSRIKRLLEDERYSGSKGYPQLIEPDVMRKAESIKKSKNNQFETDRSSKIYSISPYVVCPSCKAKMKRTNEKRNSIRNRWKCSNLSCVCSVAINDEDLIDELANLQMFLLSNPEMIIETTQDNRSKEPICVIENEIDQMLERGYVEKEKLKSKIYNSASLRYSSLDNNIYVSRRIKDLIRNHKTITTFSDILFKQTVESVSFDEDQHAKIRLINGQTIKRGERYESNGKES